MKLILPLLFTKRKKDKKTGKIKESQVVPSWNHLYTMVRNKPTLGSPAKTYKNTLIDLMKAWKHEHQWEKAVNQKVIVRIWVVFPDKRKRDCHNLDKIVLDAMEEAELFDNDANALVQYIDMTIDKEHPRFEIELILGGETIWNKTD